MKKTSGVIKKGGKISVGYFAHQRTDIMVSTPSF